MRTPGSSGGSLSSITVSRGVWKVGESHLTDMLGRRHDQIVLTPRAEFDKQYREWLKRKLPSRPRGSDSP
ncbi:hypothetical protein [Fodinicola acaciae]|uniref:hypothetical protein n=1 Tax=Fodinicola acaciae TaxID=2681555 RepID=UPI0013D8955F|nr:hypothetical protein [Fodinicola acaciae]